MTPNSVPSEDTSTSACVLGKKGSLLSLRSVSLRQWFLIWVPGPQSEKEGCGGGIHDSDSWCSRLIWGDVYHFFLKRDKDFNGLSKPIVSRKNALLALAEVVNESTKVFVQKHLWSGNLIKCTQMKYILMVS